MTYNESSPVVLCGQARTSTSSALIAHSIAGVTMIFLLYLMKIFISKRNYFPVRERAPKIAIAQCAVFLAQISLVYALEVAGILEPSWLDWSSATGAGVPVSRQVFRCLYLTVRLNVYVVFLVR